MITGASRGLGRALAAGLAREGYDLIIDARDAAALDAAAAGRCAAAESPRIPGDVTDPAHRAALARRGRAAAGRLDLLVNNAGTLGASPLPALADYPVGRAARRLRGERDRADRADPAGRCPLLRGRGGAVLNITSDAAVEAYAGWGGYGAAKAALEQASNVLAAEELARPRLVGRPRRPAHRHAPGGLPRRGHLRPAASRSRSSRRSSGSITERLPSGRYRAAHLLPAAP